MLPDASQGPEAGAFQLTDQRADTSFGALLPLSIPDGFRSSVKFFKSARLARAWL